MRILSFQMDTLNPHIGPAGPGSVSLCCGITGDVMAVKPENLACQSEQVCANLTRLCEWMG